jgi:hypothetical protein
MSVGAATGAERFVRQQQAIAEELLHPRWSMDLEGMPYHVQTIAPKATSPQPMDTRLAVSTLACNTDGELMGVFPQVAQPAVLHSAENSLNQRSVNYGGPPVP